MKIVQMTPFFYPHIGGVSQHVLEISKELVKRGHEVYVLTSLSDTHKKEEIIHGIKIYRFPILFSISEYAKVWNFIPKIVDISPDVIHSHVYGHPHSILSPIIGKIKNIPAILTTHAPFMEFGMRNFLLDLLVKINDATFGRISLSLYDRVILISKWERTYLKLLGVDESKTTIIPNGISKEFIMMKKNDRNYINNRYGLDDSWIKILFLGRVHPIKNLETLIRASLMLSRDFKIAIIIVGPYDKKYAEELLSMIDRDRKTLKLFFTGPVYDINEKMKFYDSCDIFVLPSIREASPIVLLEAMSRGCPIISSDTKGAKDIIVDGENGLLFKKGDYLDLVDKLRFLIENNTIMRNISKNNRKKAKEFTWDKIVDKLEKVYHEVLDQ